MKNKRMKLGFPGIGLFLSLTIPSTLVFAMPKPMVVKLFQEVVGSLFESNASPHYPNLYIASVKAMRDGRIGITINHDATVTSRVAGRVEYFTVPFKTFSQRTKIRIYRFDQRKQRFALWEEHSLAQLDPMQRAIGRFYSSPNANFSFVTERKFQGTDSFGIVLQSPQRESRYDDNSRLVELTSRVHRQVRRQADLAILSVGVKSVGRYCYPRVKIKNLGGEVSAHAWQGNGAALALYTRSQPTQPWQVFARMKFNEFDPTRKLQRPGGTITVTPDRAIDRGARFKVVIDDRNNILESNESNNTKELYLMCHMHAVPGRSPVLPRKNRQRPATEPVPGVPVNPENLRRPGHVPKY